MDAAHRSDSSKFPVPIVDAHHHLWDLNKVSYEWLSNSQSPPSISSKECGPENYLVDNFCKDWGNLPVKKTVHIEAGAVHNQHMLEALIMQGLAYDSSYPSAIISYCDLTDSEVEIALDSLSALNQFRGVHQPLGIACNDKVMDDVSCLLTDKKWLRGLSALAERELVLDMLLVPKQLEQAALVFSQVPQLKVALNYCGCPEPNNLDGLDEWRVGLSKLAELPNVHCKISGLINLFPNQDYSFYIPLIQSVLDIFGSDRCFFGSSFPLNRPWVKYSDLWQAYFELVQHYSHSHKPLTDDQIAGLFYDNAARFYRL